MLNMILKGGDRMEEKAFQYVEFEEISSEEFNGISVGQVAAFGAGVAVGALVIT